MNLIGAPKELEKIAEELEIQYSEFYGVPRDEFDVEVTFELGKESRIRYSSDSTKPLELMLYKNADPISIPFIHEYRHAIHLLIRRYVMKEGSREEYINRVDIMRHEY